MRAPRSSTLGLLLWSGLVLLSLRPVPAVDRTVQELTSPLRWVAELAAPLSLVRAAEAWAAERELAERAPLEARENLALLEDLARFAEPTDPALRAGRRLVHAEVLGRVPGSRDRLRVMLRDGREILPDLPVASGDAYVGRVARVGAIGADGRALAEVELVTAKGFHVGARVRRGPGEESVYMAVGGVDAAGPRGGLSELRLAVKNPSDRELGGGLARVHELFGAAEPFAGLAEGLRLGPVRADATGERWTILPELDYVDGLFQVVVLAPPSDLPARAAPPPVLVDPHWVKTSPLSLGDPSPWREAVKVRAGTSRGVRAGAAVTAVGARLVGRVTRATRWTADVSFLGDRGFSVVAVARIEGEERPFVLGRLTSLGRDGEDAVLLRWVPRVGPAEPTSSAGAGPAPSHRRARLFTGSGDPGLAGGFLLGEAHIASTWTPGVAETIRLERDVDPQALGTLFVRAVPEPGAVP